MSRTLLILLALFLAGCDEGSPVDPDLGCTFQAFPAVEVIAADSETNVLITDTLTLTLTDGAFRDVRVRPGPKIGGAHARAGVYEVEVAAEGYVTWTRGSVAATRDHCHVHTQTLLAYLEPLG